MSMIEEWLDRGREYPMPNGQQGWVAYRDELVALLSECTDRVPLSVIPDHLSDDTTTFYVQLSVTLARSEMDGADATVDLNHAEAEVDRLRAAVERVRVLANGPYPHARNITGDDLTRALDGTDA